MQNIIKEDALGLAALSELESTESAEIDEHPHNQNVEVNIQYPQHKNAKSREFKLKPRQPR